MAKGNKKQTTEPTIENNQAMVDYQTEQNKEKPKGKYHFRFEFELEGLNRSYQGTRNIEADADTPDEGLIEAQKIVNEQIPKSWKAKHTGKFAKRSN